MGDALRIRSGQAENTEKERAFARGRRFGGFTGRHRGRRIMIWEGIWVKGMGTRLREKASLRRSHGRERPERATQGRRRRG